MTSLRHLLNVMDVLRTSHKREHTVFTVCIHGKKRDFSLNTNNLQTTKQWNENNA